MTEKNLLRYPDIEARYGLARTVVKELVAQGDFPKPRLLHPNGRVRVWLEEEVSAWARNLPPAPSEPAPMGTGTYCGEEY